MKGLIKAMKVVFIVFFVFLGTLFFREQRLPQSWVERATDYVSTSNVIFRCEGAAFGFSRGLHLKGLRIYDRGKANNLEPVASARSVTVNPVLRTVRVVEAKYPRLPDSYYSSECRERNERLDFDMPRIPEFRLTLLRPEILGIAPERVTAQVNVRRKWFMLDEIRVTWPGGDSRLFADGSFRFDLVSQTAHGEVRGRSNVELIRPLIVALDVPSALPYMDAFTEIPEPVPASGVFDVNLENGDFNMSLDLKPTMGRYNGVPMSKAEGTIDLYAYTRGTNGNVNLDVRLPLALDPEGCRLSGSIGVRLTNGVARLAYDVDSRIGFREALEIANFIDPADLDMVVCDTKPVITVKGRSGTSVADSDHNDIEFSARLERGSFMGLQLRDASAKFSLAKDRLDFESVTARGKTGGQYDATAFLWFPGFDMANAEFGIKVKCAGGSLEELADTLSFDLGERDGKVDGWCEFSGPLSTNYAPRLNGRGSVKITEGHLAQMKLFAGLTKQLADKVPGVGFLVNQSDASVDFTVTNGVFRSDNVFIEGGLISLKGWGSYDIVKDNLDFTVRVQFLKNESVLGKVVHPVTWPFTKLLLEFKARGPLDSPEWDYISILDRIL